MRRRRGLNSAISHLLFSELRFYSRNSPEQKRYSQTNAPNAASAASFNPYRFSQSVNRSKRSKPSARIDNFLSAPEIFEELSLVTAFAGLVNKINLLHAEIPNHYGDQFAEKMIFHDPMPLALIICCEHGQSTCIHLAEPRVDTLTDTQIKERVVICD